MSNKKEDKIENNFNKNILKKKKADVDMDTIFWLIVSLILLVVFIVILILSRKQGTNILDFIRSKFILWGD